LRPPRLSCCEANTGERPPIPSGFGLHGGLRPASASNLAQQIGGWPIRVLCPRSIWCTKRREPPRPAAAVGTSVPTRRAAAAIGCSIDAVTRAAGR
jgi:hypothetical protein